MDTEDLQAFVAVAELGGFSRGGDRLGVAQSVISKRIARLEALLGARLLDRSIRNAVTLTFEGANFLPEARKALDATEQALRIGRNIARGEVGPLRIGYVFSAMMTGLLTDLVARLRTELPRLRLEPQLLETPEQLRAISEGRLDLGLLRPRLSYPEGTTSRVVHTESLILGMSVDHPLAENRAISCEQLTGQVLIIPQFHEEVGLIDAIRKIAVRGGFAMPDLVKTGDFVTAAALAAAGEGIVVAPASLERLILPGICYHPFSNADLSVELAMVCRKDMPPRAVSILSGQFSGG